MKNEIIFDPNLFKLLHTCILLLLLFLCRPPSCMFNYFFFVCYNIQKLPWPGFGRRWTLVIYLYELKPGMHVKLMLF